MHRNISMVDGVQYTTEKHQKLIDLAFPDNATTSRTVQYHREPTRTELHFGEGATHYKSFAHAFCLNKAGQLKTWLVCPLDGLRYYRSRY